MSDPKDHQDEHLEEELMEESLPHEEENTETSQVAELEDKLLRIQADFVNMKNRMEREKMEFSAFANQSLLEGLIPSLDTLKQAIHFMPEDIKENPWSQGITAYSTMLQSYLESVGLSIIPVTPGETEFDPTFHDAVAREEDPEHDGKVLEVLQDGYLFKGEKVLRTAKVKVAG